jgi:hypothetical protein
MVLMCLTAGEDYSSVNGWKVLLRTDDFNPVAISKQVVVGALPLATAFHQSSHQPISAQAILQ